VTDGLLIIDKGPGMTSHDVVACVRRLIRQRQIGHTGTLDPLATGVLVLCLGRATRLVEYLQGHDKRYVATIRLGEATDTYDADGQVVSQSPLPPLSDTELTTHLQQFQGTIQQRPPVFSAIKVEGVAAHYRVRRGEDVVLPLRAVEIREIHLLEWKAPDLRVEVLCSAGTYVRSIAHDLGEALGCGGHLRALRRIASGPFTTDDAIPLDELEQLVASGSWQEHVLPMAAAIAEMPRLDLSEAAVTAVRFGQGVPGPEAEDGDLAAGLAPDGDLVAILRFDPLRQGWQPQKVFSVERGA
jgi:tRNA pseudouridine55 synthase